VDDRVVAILTSGAPHTAMAISRSTDGGLTWNNPVNVTPNVENSDKTWVACGQQCDQPVLWALLCRVGRQPRGRRHLLNTSTDGGLTWGPSKQPAGGPTGLGGMPLVKPNGIVIVPSSDAFLTSLIAYGSRDGGNTWSSAVTIAFPSTHLIAGGLRDLNLPSAAMDAGARVRGLA